MTEIYLDRRPAGFTLAPSLRRWMRRGARALVRLRLLAGAAPRLSDPVSLSLACVAAFSAIFLAFPGLDLAAAEVFYRAGEGFPLSRDPVLRAFRESSDLVLIVLIPGLIGRLAWLLIRNGGDALAAARRTGFLLAALVVGPGLVVNGVLKAWWGRPRPVMVDQFGGDAPYQLVWKVSDWCASNCSFVSGEASSAAWLVAALVLVPERFRAAAVPPVIVYAGLLSLNRLAFGGHFLSDVVLSWAISALVFAGLYRLMVSAPGVACRSRVRAWKGAVPAAA
jgi:lipid A 4'-phosphatase